MKRSTIPCGLVLLSVTVLAVPPRPAPVGAKADYHVHIKGDLSLDEAVRRSKVNGIAYGVAINGGLRQAASDDSTAEVYVKTFSPHPFFLAFQAEGREWVTLFSNATLQKFDYIITDSMTWTDDTGKRMRLWIPEEVGTIPDAEKFMDTLVARTTKIFAEEPIDIYVNPTFLPDQLSGQYDKLWTPSRMKQVVDGLAANGIGLEINNRYRLPSRALIMMAKQAGVKFSCGTNNTGAKDLGRNEYCIEMIKACSLKTENFWSPPADANKAIRRRPLRQ